MHFNKKKLATNLVRKKKYTTKIVALESFLKICPHETEEDANANDPEEGMVGGGGGGGNAGEEEGEGSSEGRGASGIHHRRGSGRERLVGQLIGGGERLIGGDEK
jgi:uncharacterized membrane protein YgcG